MSVDNTEIANLAEAMDNTFEKMGNKVTTLSSNCTDDEYPSAKCMYDLIGVAIAFINR